MRAIDIGTGARHVLGEPGQGRVLAAYRKAAYLQLPRGLCALTSPAAPPGALHLRCSVLPQCRPGSRVRTDGRTVSGADWAVPVAAPLWSGTTPPAELLAGAITPAQLVPLAARLGGRGAGLTPSGDDVLAGLLLVARAAGGSVVEPALVTTAQSVRTTAVAAAFLSWAARGQCIAPAHNVLHALAERGPDATTPECTRLTTIGASSGRALLAGIRLGLGANSGRPPGSLNTMMDDHLAS